MTLVWWTNIVFQKKKEVYSSSTKSIAGSENDVKNVDSSWFSEEKSRFSEEKRRFSEEKRLRKKTKVDSMLRF